MTYHNNWLKGRTLIVQPPIKTVKPSQSPSWIRAIWSLCKGTLRSICLFLGALMLSLILLTWWGVHSSQNAAAPSLPQEMILSLDLNGAYPESSAVDIYMALLGSENVQLSIDDVIDTLSAATRDPKVKAIVVNAAAGGYDITQIQQIRSSIKSFRAAGKKAYIYSESYGEGGHGLGLYYLASAFDEIWLQPVGSVTLGGINLETPYFKKLMDEYGVKAQFFHRKEYKNAMEHLTADHMSDVSREMMQGLVTELAGQLVAPIKADRKLVTKNFDTLLDQGLLTDLDAKAAGLIDRIDYEDKLFDKLQNTYKKTGLVSVEDYFSYRQKEYLTANILSQNAMATAAIIHVNGMILSSSGDSSPFAMQEGIAGADVIADAIRQAAEDKNIKTIVLRVNSPGGSPTASETIYRAVQWAMNVKKKPVIVSMGSVAASGGYWISAGASKIYALDTTLTGSIGVVGGKINLQDFWKKFDVSWGSVKYGENAGLMSFNTPFSEAEQKQFELSLDRIYEAFISRVAKGRKMTPDQVEAVAKGHVWTGRQALKLGLVDAIGGMDKVLDDVAKKQGLADRTKLNVVHLPAAESPFDMVLQMMSSEASLSPSLQQLKVISQLQGARPYVLDTQLLISPSF